jgi:hypothetical protein
LHTVRKQMPVMQHNRFQPTLIAPVENSSNKE